MSDSPDWSAALTGLGSHWNITEMTFKNHGCCGHTFAAIDGALVLRERMGIDASAIRSVAVATYGAALEVANIEHPRTEAEAKFSLRYVVASALIHGSVRLDAMSPERLASPQIRDLMTRISVSLDPAIDRAFPGQRAAHVTLTERSGRSESFFQPTRIGDPDAPLSDRQLDDKFLELCSPTLGEARARSWLTGLWELDRHAAPFPF